MDVLLDCLCSLSPCCSCYRPRNSHTDWDLYEPLLHESERGAVNDLLNYLNKESNKLVIIQSGAVGLLIQLMTSRDFEVQCNTCGCITALATTDINKKAIVNAGGIEPLLILCKSHDVRVQRNATGALLNLTHIASSRNEMVSQGAIPTFINCLRSKDSDVLYYCTAALSNIAVDHRYRCMMIAVGHYDVIRSFISLLSYPADKVKCQACLALRNMASDDDNQVLIVTLGVLPSLYNIINSGIKDTLTAAVAVLRNLSIHRKNEVTIVREGFMPEICRILLDADSLPEAKCHAAGTMRNLAAGEQMKVK
uniref:Vacuolar protein 8 n=1 Tax=Saccoglossus kowalevskii TaxID=10224 RepID=A0ABM0N033_SACKO|nr:PREDICTED: vacuolar protein 8-like [Saccoglossus kowalevskii]